MKNRFLLLILASLFIFKGVAQTEKPHLIFESVEKNHGLVTVGGVVFTTIVADQIRKELKKNKAKKEALQKEIVSLYDGKYDEIHIKERYKKVGKVLVDMETEKIVGFAIEDSLDFQPEVLSRFPSIDPLASKYPAISPYAFVQNNPIIYVDPDGRENVIYLVVVNGSQGSQITKENAQTIANKANALYEGMGLKTRVVVYDPVVSGGDINTKFLEATDGVAVIGNDRTTITNYIKENVNQSFAVNELEGQGFLTDASNTEKSANPKNEGAGNLGIALVYNDTEERIKDKMIYTNTKLINFSTEDFVAFSLVHGGGHNAGLNHTKHSMMQTGGTALSTMVQNGTTPSNFKLDAKDLVKYKSRFNGNSSDNYNRLRQKYNSYTRKYGETRGNKIYEGYKQAGQNSKN